MLSAYILFAFLEISFLPLQKEARTMEGGAGELCSGFSVGLGGSGFPFSLPGLFCGGQDLTPSVWREK